MEFATSRFDINIYCTDFGGKFGFVALCSSTSFSFQSKKLLCFSQNVHFCGYEMLIQSAQFF